MAYIRKQKQGSRVYYWLVESYRDKETGKVKTRKLRYLGDKYPPGHINSDRQLECFRAHLKDMVFKSKPPQVKTNKEKIEEMLKLASKLTGKMIEVNPAELTDSDKFSLWLAEGGMSDFKKKMDHDA